MRKIGKIRRRGKIGEWRRDGGAEEQWQGKTRGRGCLAAGEKVPFRASMERGPLFRDWNRKSRGNWNRSVRPDRRNGEEAKPNEGVSVGGDRAIGTSPVRGAARGLAIQRGSRPSPYTDRCFGPREPKPAIFSRTFLPLSLFFPVFPNASDPSSPSIETDNESPPFRDRATIFFFEQRDARSFHDSLIYR